MSQTRSRHSTGFLATSLTSCQTLLSHWPRAGEKRGEEEQVGEEEAREDGEQGRGLLTMDPTARHTESSNPAGPGSPLRGAL